MMKPSLIAEVLRTCGCDDSQISRMLAAAESGTSDTDAQVIAAATHGLCKMSPMQARAVARHNNSLMRVFNFVEARCARYGIQLGDQELNLRDVDAALKAANASIDDRMLFKGKLHELRLI